MTICALEQVKLRRGLSAFPTGVTAIAALVDGAPVGLAASSFTSVSLDPPIVSICVAHTSTTWPVLRTAPRLGISVLAADQEQESRALSARTGNRFASLRWRATAGGAVMLDGVSAWLDCSVEREISVGDHDIVLLLVHALEADTAVAPLIFHASRYRRLEARGAPEACPARELQRCATGQQ